MRCQGNEEQAFEQLNEQPVTVWCLLPVTGPLGEPASLAVIKNTERTLGSQSRGRSRGQLPNPQMRPALQWRIVASAENAEKDETAGVGATGVTFRMAGVEVASATRRAPSKRRCQ